MVLSGHISSDTIVRTTLIGDNGNEVTAMLIDPQTLDTISGIGPTGMVTMLYFSEDGKSIYVETISTIEEKYFMEENQFTLDIDSWTPAEGMSMLGASLNITNDINVLYTVNVPVGYTDPYMVFEFNGKSYTVTNRDIDTRGKSVFKFVGVVPQMIGENIKATLYATNGGNLESVTKAEYSVKTYCVNWLAKDIDTDFRALLSDLLAYGAAAQQYNDQTDGLVNENVTGYAPGTFAEVTETVKGISGGTENDPAKWNSVALRYENAMAMKFKFTATDTTLTVKISINGKETTYKVSDLTKEGDNYVVYFRGILATEYGDVVTATFYNGDTQVGQSATYSVNSYVYSKQGDSNTALADLVKATYNYGVSASAYAGQ